MNLIFMRHGEATDNVKGLISDKEYKPIKEQREEWRKQINDYEALLPEAKDEWENSFLYDEEGETDI